MGSFFEGIGVLVYRKLISPEIIDDLISSYVIRYWELMKPAIQGYREEFNIPQAYEWIEYLYNEIKKIAEKQHPELTQDTIKNYNP